MIRTVIESPFAGNVTENIAYAKRCMINCLLRNEAPYASHLLLPQVLDDLDPADREIGIAAGLAWGSSADLIAVYIDRGVSRGMRQSIAAALKRGTTVVFRSLDRKDEEIAQHELWTQLGFAPATCTREPALDAPKAIVDLAIAWRRRPTRDALDLLAEAVDASSTCNVVNGR